MRSPTTASTAVDALLALAAGRPPSASCRTWEARDDDALLRLAARHQVEALCHWHAERSRASDAASVGPTSERVWRAWRLAFAHHALRNEALARDVAHLARSLRHGGVEALWLKGPWVVFAAYPHPATRCVNDIDLCIRESDYRAALEALERAGYRPASTVPATAEAALARAHFDRQLRFVANARRPVELHFRMVHCGPPAIDESWSWDAREPLLVGGERVSVPAPEPMLLHLALHANQHGFVSLRLLQDVRFAIEALRPRLDERRFLELVVRLRCRSAVYHAFQLAVELADARVPELLLDALRPVRARRWFFSCCWRLARVRRLDAEPAPSEFEAPRFFLLEMGTLLEKARYVRGLIAETGGVMALAHRAASALRRRTRTRFDHRGAAARPTAHSAPARAR